MDVLYLIGRIIFAALFLGSSVAHLTDKGGMAGYAESRGVRPARPAVLIHSFWRDKEPMARMNEMVQFQKDMALTGASLILLYLAWTADDLPFTITGALFNP